MTQISKTSAVKKEKTKPKILSKPEGVTELKAVIFSQNTEFSVSDIIIARLYGIVRLQVSCALYPSGGHTEHTVAEF